MCAINQPPNCSKKRYCWEVSQNEKENVFNAGAFYDAVVLTFDDEYPLQSTADHLKDGTKLVIAAKADDDWNFVKWTLNGEDDSTDEQ